MSSLVSRSALRKKKKNTAAQSVKVALVGLNRTSGSLGFALRHLNARPNTGLEFSVIGRDEDNEAMKTAHRIGAIDNYNKALQIAVDEADIVFVSVPLAALDELFSRLGGMLKPGAVVIDLSPLKQPALKLAEKYFAKDNNGQVSNYLIGATPLVGFDQLYATDLSVAASQEFLFRGSDMLIAPAATVPAEAVKVVTDLAEMLNMKPRFMDPAEYDGLASLTESTPLLLSALMFQVVHQSPGKIDVLRATNPTFASMVQNLRQVNAADLALLWRSTHASLLQQVDQTLNNLEAIRALLLEKEDAVLETYLTQLLNGFITWEVNREQNRWDKLDSTLDDIHVGIPVIGGGFTRRRDKKDD